MRVEKEDKIRPVGTISRDVMRVAGTRVAIANVAGSFYAFGDTCTHLGCSLSEGHLEETTVTCRCHGSRFDVTSGQVLRGPAQKSEPS